MIFVSPLAGTETASVAATRTVRHDPAATNAPPAAALLALATVAFIRQNYDGLFRRLAGGEG